MLKNPIYAGAYAYGRRQTEETLDSSLKPRKRVKSVEREKWLALLKDNHEGYIPWEVFERNMARIESNYRGETTAGAPREGDGILQGLILC